MIGLADSVRRRIPAAPGREPEGLPEVLERLTRAERGEALEETEARDLVRELLAAGAPRTEDLLAGLAEALAPLGGGEDPVEQSAAALAAAARLGRDLLALEAGTLELEEAPLDPLALVHEVCDARARRAQERGVELVVHPRGSLPASVLADGERLAALVDELVRNAVDHTRRGEILVELEARGPGLRIEVQDTGAGIAPEIQEALFQALEQDAPLPGPGLGLRLVRELCRRMGGSLGFASEPARGSTFRVDLPLSAASPPADPGTPIPGHAVLVVARSQELRSSLEELLSARGALVHTRPDPQSISPAEVLAGGYDLCLLDWDMPRGVVDFKDALCEAPEDERPWIVTLCPHGDPMVAEILGAFSGDGHLQKPISVRRLEDELAPLLARRPPRGGRGHAPEAGALRVLHVDDNVLNRRVALRMLARLGFSVEEAADGPTGLELLAREAFDLVLLDCQMPGQGGHEVVRVLRAREAERGLPRVPVLGLSALDAPSDQRRAQEVGMDGLLHKPLRLRELEETLRRVLGSLPRRD